MHLTRPDYNSHEWEILDNDLRAEVRAWLDHLASPQKPIGRWLTSIAHLMGCEYPTARRKYDAIVKRGEPWTALLDRRKAPEEILDGTGSAAFRAELLTLVERYQRKNAPAFRELYRRWDHRTHPIPGYESWPNWPARPVGWDKRSLARIVKAETNAARMRSIRVGTSSKTNIFETHLHTTRVGLWPGAIIQLDDVRHDNYVTIGKGKNLQVARVNELGALDLFSAHRFHWGAKPRLRRDNGKFQDLELTDMRMFIAGMFYQHGYSPRGTMLMSEWQTAKVEQRIAKLLFDYSGGAIRVDYQPIEGKQAALTGFWSGTEGGNFRAKACLESTHALIHNDLSNLLLQTGSPSSGLKAPVNTKRIVDYIQGIMREVLKKCPHRAHLLRLPALDYHTQFVPFLIDYYQFGLATRTDHQLEGWEILNHVVSEYTALPGSNTWMNEIQFLDDDFLDSDSRTIITNGVRRDPSRWMRRRNLSPVEVWNRRDNFLPLPRAIFCEIIGEDLAREVTARRGFITFEDQEISCDPLIYKARYCTGPKRGQEIQHGEKVQIYVMPFNDSTAFVRDAAGRDLGEIPLVKRVIPIDPEAFTTTEPFESRPEIRSQALKEAAGDKHARIAENLEPLRINHREEVQEARDLRAHNRKVINGEPITPDEIHDARVAAGQQAHRTAAANRLQAHGQPIDYDLVEDAEEIWQDPFASLPESNHFPDSI